MHPIGPLSYWLRDITSKSIEKSESGPLEPNRCIPIWDLVGGLGKRSKNWREEDRGEIVEEFMRRRHGETRDRAGSSYVLEAFKREGTRAAVPLWEPRCWMEGTATIRKVLELSTRSMRATPTSLLTGTVNWLRAAQWADSYANHTTTAVSKSQTSKQRWYKHQQAKTIRRSVLIYVIIFSSLLMACSDRVPDI